MNSPSQVCRRIIKTVHKVGRLFLTTDFVLMAAHNQAGMEVDIFYRFSIKYYCKTIKHVVYSLQYTFVEGHCYVERLKVAHPQ